MIKQKFVHLFCRQNFISTWDSGRETESLKPYKIEAEKENVFHHKNQDIILAERSLLHH